MKRKILLLITFLCIFSPVALAQSGEIKRCTEEQLPLESRTDYIEQATEFLRSYYNQLMLNVGELIIQKEFVKKNMYSESQRYKPEFLFEGSKDVNYLLPNQYLQELEKQFNGYDIDNIEITIDNVNINLKDFFLPNLISCYLIADYDLTFTNDSENLFKRRCRAYCLFPNAMAYINVKLMQVEPVKDIIPYKPKSNESVLVPDDMDETNKALWQKAQNGDVSAQKDLADKYYYGRGVKQDYTKAAIWYAKAAKKGNAYAQCFLGYCYKNGQGVEKNFTEAVKWYTKAAEKGFAPAQRNLGYCYEKGQGVEQNFTEAVKWYTKAAEKGDALAQYNLGICYEYGRGVEKNSTEAVKWYTKARKKGLSQRKINSGTYNQ